MVSGISFMTVFESLFCYKGRILILNPNCILASHTHIEAFLHFRRETIKVVWDNITKRIKKPISYYLLLKVLFCWSSVLILLVIHLQSLREGYYSIAFYSILRVVVNLFYFLTVCIVISYYSTQPPCHRNRYFIGVCFSLSPFLFCYFVPDVSGYCQSQTQFSQQSCFKSSLSKNMSILIVQGLKPWQF